MVLVTFRRHDRRIGLPSRGGLAWRATGAGTWTGSDRRGRFAGLIERLDDRFVAMTADGQELDPQASLDAAMDLIVRARPSSLPVSLVVHVVGAAGSIAVLAGVIDIVSRGL